MVERKLVSVVMQYDDGLKVRLEGEDAQKWFVSVNGMAALGLSHGIEMPTLAWKTEYMFAPPMRCALCGEKIKANDTHVCWGPANRGTGR